MVDGRRCVNCGTKLEKFERSDRLRVMKIFNKKYCAQCTLLGVFIEESSHVKSAATTAVKETRDLPANIFQVVKGIISRAR